MTATATTTFPCPRCGNILMYGQLACPRCGGLVYTERLNELAAGAQQEEANGNPVRAALIWQQALPLLPPDSQQHRMVTQRIGALTAGIAPQTLDYASPPPTTRAVRPPDPLPLAIAKTLGSMIVSIIVYTMMFSPGHEPGFGL